MSAGWNGTLLLTIWSSQLKLITGLKNKQHSRDIEHECRVNGALLLTICSLLKLKKTFPEGPTPSLGQATIMSNRKFPPPPNTSSLSTPFFFPLYTCLIGLSCLHCILIAIFH